jgi:hypothetical protein
MRNRLPRMFGDYGGAAALIATIGVGVIFRTIWLQDVEYKVDEAWTFHQVRAFWTTHELPLLGMPSSANVPNAGLSVWIFVALSTFVPIENPLALTRTVQLINVTAVLLLAVFAYRCVERPDRGPWLWSVAMVSVNPLAVLFSRKLWAQDCLPIFTLGMLFGWWYRGRWWGAFLWGLIGAALGQIHLGGFFFAAAFVACVVLFDRRSAHWSAWSTGTLVGVLPIAPWVWRVIELGQNANAGDWSNLVPLFLERWFSMALGLDLHYSLGNDLLDFLSHPVIGGVHTYVAAGLLALASACFIALCGRLIRRFGTDRAATVAQFTNMGSKSILVLTAGLWGYGILLTLTLRPVYLHYYVITFSLPALSVAWLARAGSARTDTSVAAARALLSTLVLAQAGLTALFLWYIHTTQVIDGDYGTAYGSQLRAGLDRSSADIRR